MQLSISHLKEAPGLALPSPEAAHTIVQVLRSFLGGQVGLVLLTVEAEQAVLIAEMLHLAAPLHLLFKHSLRLTTVTPYSLNAKGDVHIFKQALGKKSVLHFRRLHFKSTEDSVPLYS